MASKGREPSKLLSTRDCVGERWERPRVEGERAHDPPYSPSNAVRDPSRAESWAEQRVSAKHHAWIHSLCGAKFASRGVLEKIGERKPDRPCGIHFPRT